MQWLPVAFSTQTPLNYQCQSQYKSYTPSLHPSCTSILIDVAVCLTRSQEVSTTKYHCSIPPALPLQARGPATSAAAACVSPATYQRTRHVPGPQRSWPPPRRCGSRTLAPPAAPAAAPPCPRASPDIPGSPSPDLPAHTCKPSVHIMAHHVLRAAH
jgi:hypothetical protein